MRDICLISRDAGHLMKMRDCPSECGTVYTYALETRPVVLIDASILESSRVCLLF